MQQPARVRLILLAALVLCVGGAVAYFLWPNPDRHTEPPFEFDEPAPPNPQLAFDTPFRNVRPSVAYVGDQACVACHAEIHKNFHAHPMGRSATTQSTDRYTPDTQPTFRSPQGREYRVVVKDGRVVHTEKHHAFDGSTQTTTPVYADIVIGSGQLGKSYLCVRDGSVWQTGISWFSNTQRWDVSPGFVPGRHGTRSIVPGCLHCHVNQVEPIPGTINRYQEPLLGQQAAIGCERCHGPGQIHVAERMAAKDTKIPDTSIVNPKHLAPALRDAICQQCHLQGEERVTRRGRDLFEFRPGLPLELFQSIYVKPPESVPYQKSVGQVEQIRSSKCATASNGQLSCTSCHDPHVMPTAATKEQHYRQACQKCHVDKGCTAPRVERQAKNDACVQCHMTTGGSSNIPHASVTDHRITRKATTVPKVPSKVGNLPFVLFHEQQPYSPDADEKNRDLGIALGHFVLDKEPSQTLAEMSQKLLKEAVTRHPSDWAAWEMLARLHAQRGQWKDAYAAIRKALAIFPKNETALQHSAEYSFALDQFEQSLADGQAAVALNPGNLDNTIIVGNAYLGLEKTAEAYTAFQHVLDIIPTHANAQVGVAICLHRRGEHHAARVKLELATELDPPNAGRLREWFRQKTK